MIKLVNKKKSVDNIVIGKNIYDVFKKSIIFGSHTVELYFKKYKTISFLYYNEHHSYLLNENDIIVDNNGDGCSLIDDKNFIIHFSSKSNIIKIYNENLKVITIDGNHKYIGNQDDDVFIFSDNNNIIKFVNFTKNSITSTNYILSNVDGYLYNNRYLNVVINDINHIYDIMTDLLIPVNNIVICAWCNNNEYVLYYNVDDKDKYGILKIDENKIEILLQPNYVKIIETDGIFHLYKNNTDEFICTKDFSIFSPPTTILNKHNSNNYIIKNHHYGLLDENLNIILPCEYKEIINVMTDVYKLITSNGLNKILLTKTKQFIEYEQYNDSNKNIIQLFNNTNNYSNLIETYICDGMYFENKQELLKHIFKHDSSYLYLTLVLNKNLTDVYNNYQYEMNKKYTDLSIYTYTIEDEIHKIYDSNVHNKYVVKVDLNQKHIFFNSNKLHFDNFEIIS